MTNCFLYSAHKIKSNFIYIGNVEFFVYFICDLSRYIICKETCNNDFLHRTERNVEKLREILSKKGMTNKKI